MQTKDKAASVEGIKQLYDIIEKDIGAVEEETNQLKVDLTDIENTVFGDSADIPIAKTENGKRWANSGSGLSFGDSATYHYVAYDINDLTDTFFAYFSDLSIQGNTVVAFTTGLNSGATLPDYMSANNVRNNYLGLCAWNSIDKIATFYKAKIIEKFPTAKYLFFNLVNNIDYVINENTGNGLVGEVQDHEERITALENVTPTEKKELICWGNSLTHGATTSYSNAYPKQLKAILGDAWTVLNWGVSGESVLSIGGRQGGNPLMVDSINIPSGTSSVPITFYSLAGSEAPEPIKNGTADFDRGFNPCTIEGVEGTIACDGNGNYTFTRNASGNAVTVTRPTRIYTRGEWKIGQPIVLWTGENGGFETIDELIELEQMIIDYAKTDKYLIIGRSNISYKGTWKDYHAKMLRRHGRKYINITEYLCKFGLSDLGITPTAQDEARIADGNIPSSLQVSDLVHLTTDAYGIVANVVYKRGKELGYWE